MLFSKSRWGLVPGAFVFDGSDLRGQCSGCEDLEDRAKLDLFAEKMEQLVFLTELSGFDGKDHLIDATGVGDFDLPTLDLFETCHDLLDLMRVDEHALDAGGGVYATDNTTETGAGTPTAAWGAVEVTEIASGESDERVGLVEGRDDDFADFAILELDTGVGMADFDEGAVGEM